MRRFSTPIVGPNGQYDQFLLSNFINEAPGAASPVADGLGRCPVFFPVCWTVASTAKFSKIGASFNVNHPWIQSSQTVDRFYRRYRSPVSLAILAGLSTVLLLLIPAEQTLGNIIKVIFLHGALVEVGLVVFAAAGLMGLASLVWRTEAPDRWSLALQKTGVIVWIVYALSSMVSTKLAWGQWIAWDEPRVRASALVLGFSILCLLFVLWVNNRFFTALTNVAVAGVSWYLVKGASILRHPFDPIGASSSERYRLYFIVLIVLVLLLAAQLTLWLRQADPRSAQE